MLLPAVQVWRQHWDFQLYKALEYQYMQGLECINRTLPDVGLHLPACLPGDAAAEAASELPQVEVRMEHKQHKLQYNPPLEDLRVRHYKEYLNTFLGLPLRCAQRWATVADPGGLPLRAQPQAAHADKASAGPSACLPARLAPEPGCPPGLPLAG